MNTFHFFCQYVSKVVFCKFDLLNVGHGKLVPAQQCIVENSFQAYEVYSLKNSVSEMILFKNTQKRGLEVR